MGKTVHMTYDGAVDEAVVYFVGQPILVNAFQWEDVDWHAYVFLAIKSCIKVEVFGIYVDVFAPFVQMTLFHMSLVVVGGELIKSEIYFLLKK